MLIRVPISQYFLFGLFSEHIPSEATFYGGQYLSYDLSNRGDPIVSNNDQVSFYFKTRQANGLLFYTGNLGRLKQFNGN